MNELIPLNQHDKRWADLPLGFGNTKIGTHGCYITCHAIIEGTTPDDINDLFKTRGAFDGDLLKHPDDAFALGYYSYEKTDAAPNFVCIAEVDFNPDPDKDQHFVVWIGDGNIIDPWDGSKKDKSAYAKYLSFRIYKKMATTKELPELKEIVKYPMISKMAAAIQKHEGWYPGSRSFRNNNPGNLRFTDYVKNDLGASGKESGGTFAVWPTYEDGLNGLKIFIYHAAIDVLRSYKSSMSLYDYFAVYAPSSDNNTPTKYAEAVMADMGVTAKFILKDLLASPESSKEKFAVRLGRLIGKNLGENINEKEEAIVLSRVQEYLDHIAVSDKKIKTQSETLAIYAEKIKSLEADNAKLKDYEANGTSAIGVLKALQIAIKALLDFKF